MAKDFRWREKALVKTFSLVFASIILNANPFHYPKEIVEVNKKMLSKRKDFTIYQMDFPSPIKTRWEENNRVFVYLYSPPNPKGKVLVLHTLGTKNLNLEEEICRRFAQMGYEGAALVLPYHLQRRPAGLSKGWGFTASPSVMRETLIQSVDDVRSFLDIWCGKEGVAIVGLSLGAIVGALVMGVDERVQRGVFIMGGGNLPLLLTHSLLFALKSFRWSREELSLLWDVDPLRYAYLIPPRPVLLINGRFDFVVPYNCSYAIWKAMGKPSAEWLWCGHYGALLIKDKILRKTLKFIKEVH
jgi:dienelactone hydrolase